MKVYIDNFNDVLTPLRKRLEVTTDALSADAFLLWQDVLGGGQALAKVGKELNKRVVVVEHGFRAHSDYGPPNNWPLLADFICVTGEKAKRNLISYGIAPERIVVTGSPIFDRLRPRVPDDKFTVVFAPLHEPKDLPENWDIAQKLREVEGVEIVTKLTEEHKKDKYDNTLISHRQSPGHLDLCAEVLQMADLVVALTEGTFEAMAYALDIPVLLVDHWGPKQFSGRWTEKADSEPAGGGESVTLEGLPEAIRLYQADPTRGREKRQAYVRDSILLGNATENIARVVEGLTVADSGLPGLP